MVYRMVSSARRSVTIRKYVVLYIVRCRYNYDSLVESCVISDSSGGDGGSDGGGSGRAGGEYSIMLLLLERRIPNVIIIYQSVQNDVLYHDQCPNIKMFMIKILRTKVLLSDYLPPGVLRSGL